MTRVVALVAAGAVVGSLLRFAVGLVATSVAGSGGWPWATFAVNITGCLLMGLFLGRVRALGEVPAHATPLIATGFLGGLTTFSAFAEETVLLGEAGAGVLAVGYVVLSVLLGVGAVWAGRLIGEGRHR